MSRYLFIIGYETETTHCVWGVQICIYMTLYMTVYPPRTPMSSNIVKQIQNKIQYV
jgi:hypothetical protein